MNKWIASIIFSFALHFAILLGYDLSSRNFTEKVDKKITGIRFIEPEKKQKKNEVLTKSSIQNITNEENLVQKPKTIEENPTDIKQKYEETTQENQAMELIDLISQKVILDIQKIWISPNNQDQNIYAEFLLTLDRAGNIKSMKLVGSSGVGAFDRSAQSAIRKYGKIEEISKLDDRTYQKYFSEFTLRFDPK